jgi:hypothetical protein
MYCGFTLPISLMKKLSKQQIIPIPHLGLHEESKKTAPYGCLSHDFLRTNIKNS